jgi:hypothetical protein
MSVVSEAYDILFLLFTHVGSIDLLIDKQEFLRKNYCKDQLSYTPDCIE